MTMPPSAFLFSIAGIAVLIAAVVSLVLRTAAGLTGQEPGQSRLRSSLDSVLTSSPNLYA